MSALGYDRRRVYLDHLRRSPNLYRAAKELLVPAEDPVGVVCSYVLAPAVGAFTMWLLNQAEKKKIQRLYFLSRDGYLFYQAARILCEAYHLPLECRYLSCSRYSLRQGMFHLDRKSALEHICRNGMEVTPSVVLRRAGLTADEQREVLHRLCLPYGEKHLLEGRELRSLQKRLSRCGLFFSYMDRHSRQALPGLTGYLQQEGLLENVKYAVVDSGWTGTTQKTLGEILRYMGRRELLEGYYWGLYELPEGVNPKAYHSYYFSPTGGLREKVAFHNCLFEVLCAAGHGMTLGYEKQRNRWAPRYGAIFPEEKEFAAKAEKYVTSYIRKLSRQPVNDGVSHRERETLRGLFWIFMCRPSPEEAKAFGKLPFSDDVLTDTEGPLAAAFTEKQLKSQRLFSRLLAAAKGEKENASPKSFWYQASAVNAVARPGVHLWQNDLYEFLRHSRTIYRMRRRKGGASS